MENQKKYEGGKKMEEITLHFGKGTAEPFTSKDGKNIWKDEKSAVPNKELKSRVEFYKEASRGKQKGGSEL